MPDADAPLVVWRNDPRRGRLVVARCPRAAAMGIRTGMSVAHAAEMGLKNANSNRLPSSPPTQQPINRPQLYQHDPDLDQQALEQVVRVIQRHVSPSVAIEPLSDRPWAGQTLHQPDSLFCDITGATHLFGDEASLLASAHKQLAKLGLIARMAIADTVGAAWGLAHFGSFSSSRHPPPEVTNTASRSLIAPIGATLQAVQELPVESLRIAPKTVATLERLGVQHVDQLLRLPRSGLATRLGKSLVQRISQMLGEADEPLNRQHLAAEHTYGLDLEYPTTDQRILADRINRLTQQVKGGLATCHRGALRLTCCLTLADHPPLTFDVGLFAPTRDCEQMSGLLIGCLQSQRLASSVTRVTLQVTLSGAMRSTQTSLFHNQDHSASCVINKTPLGGSSLPQLINALSGRLGRDAVLSVLHSDDPLPEKSFRTAPLTGRSLQNQSSRASRKQTSRSQKKQMVSASHASNTRRACGELRPSPRDAMRRPLTLLNPPLPLSPLHTPSGMPTGFRLGGSGSKVHHVVRCWGPERIETGWWNGPSVRRDYYRIETDLGHWWWVFRQLGDAPIADMDDLSAVGNWQSSSPNSFARWMLHGRFA